MCLQGAQKGVLGAKVRFRAPKPLLGPRPLWASQNANFALVFKGLYYLLQNILKVLVFIKVSILFSEIIVCFD